MQILNMRKAKDADFKTKAYFTIETKNFRIHNCRLVMGYFGRMVVQMPFRTYMDKGVQKFEPIIEPLNDDYLDAVGEEALKIYKDMAE